MCHYKLPKVILGKAYKPGSSIELGSLSLFCEHYPRAKGDLVSLYDPYIDLVAPDFEAAVFLVGTKHLEFETFEFPKGSVVIDPCRYVKGSEEVTVIPVGSGAAAADPPLLNKTFYEELIDFAQRNAKTLLGQQFQLVSNTVDRALDGGGWGVIMPRFGEILWPEEEATFLNLVCEKDRFYGETSDFLRELLAHRAWRVEERLLGDLLKYQMNMNIAPFTPKNFTIELEYNLHEYLAHVYQGVNIPLTKRHSCLTVTAEATFEGNLGLYDQKVVWYGRKGGMFRHTHVEDNELSRVRPD